MNSSSTSAAGCGELSVQLRPVGAALLSDAAAEADRIVASATGEAARKLEAAEVEAQAQVERAAARGTQTARSRAARDLANAKLDARRQVLQAQEEIRQQLEEALRTAVAGFREDGRYGDLLDELERRSRIQLGEVAAIERDPDRLGGVMAVAGSRRVDYTLDALADRAIDALGDEISELWV